MSKTNFGLLMKALELPQFNNIQELSGLIGVTESLIYCLSKRTEQYYKKFSIPKKSGGIRQIYIPSYTMKIIQKWILRNILDKVKPSNQAMAFRKGSNFSCKANAVFHKETRYGIAIDLENFFDNISAKRVYGVFRNLGYSSKSATILTNLCTLDDFLPQGAVCSPSLSNLVCLSLDARLSGLCEKRRIRYSRYADDMYFSSDNQDVLKKTVPIIRKILTDEGFCVNERKIYYHTPSNRKQINGITIHRKEFDCSEIKAPKELKRKIRTEIYRAIMSGDYSSKDHIIGEIMYVAYIEPDYLNRIKKYIVSISNKIKIFPELVEQYNNNLFFRDIDKATITPLNDIESEFDNCDEFFEYMLNLFSNRKCYIEKCKINDICHYINWPPVDESFESENCSEKDLPF